MALRAPHGRAVDHGTPGPRIEVLPPDELPAAIPAEQQSGPISGERKMGLFIKGRTDPAQIAGGKARGRPSLVSTLGLPKGSAPTSAEFTPYRGKAASFRRAHCAELAALAGGTCGTAPSSFVATASLQLAVSRWLYDQATRTTIIDTNLLREARQQGDSSRQNLLAAYELAIREGNARGAAAGRGYDIDAVTKRAEAEAEKRRRVGAEVDG